MIKSIATLASLAVLAGCGADSEPAAAPEPTARVRISPAIEGAASETLTVFGAAESGPGGERSLTAQAEAVLERIVAPTGTSVRAGDVVAVLQPSATTRAESAKAASEAAAAQAAYARARRMRADGLMSDADVEAARATAVTAQAARSSAAQRNASLTLRAPAAGAVQGLTAKPGDAIAAGTVVATIGTGRALRARFGVDPAIAPRLHAGQSIRFGAIGAATPIRASITGVDPQVDPVTRLAAIFAHVPAGSGIGAGQSLRGVVTLGGRSNGLTIPYAALLDDGGRSYVFVVSHGVARARDVLPGSSAGERIQILRGLAAGEQVVTEGGTALEDGMQVTTAPGAVR
jgi:RND family efflux transporter MFP subunit